MGKMNKCENCKYNVPAPIGACLKRTDEELGVLVKCRTLTHNLKHPDLWEEYKNGCKGDESVNYINNKEEWFYMQFDFGIFKKTIQINTQKMESGRILAEDLDTLFSSIKETIINMYNRMKSE